MNRDGPPLRLGCVSRLPSSEPRPGPAGPGGPQARGREAEPKRDETGVTTADERPAIAPDGARPGLSRRVRIAASASIVAFATAWISAWPALSSSGSVASGQSPPDASAREDKSPGRVVPGPPAPRSVGSIEGQVAEQARVTDDLIAARRKVERDLSAARARLVAEERALARIALRRRPSEALSGLIDWSESTFRRLGSLATAASPTDAADSPHVGTSTIEVLMPAPTAQLDVKGEGDEGGLDDRDGARRVVHTPLLSGASSCRVGASWMDAFGIPRTRACKLTVSPGQSYEVDLRGEEPTFRILERR